MKKILSFARIIAAFLSLCACGSEKSDIINGDVTLTLNIPDEGVFSATASVNGYVLTQTDTVVTLTKDGDALTYFKAEYLDGKDADTLSPSFLDNTVKAFQNLEYPGTMEIGKDGLFTEQVTGYDDTQYATAFILNTHSGALAMTVSVSEKAKETELSVLSAFVNEFTIEAQ